MEKRGVGKKERTMLVKEARTRTRSSAPERKANIVVTNLERARGPIVELVTRVVQ